MSYILEALKRADAERERGAVPTLRSHGTPAATVTTGRPATRVWITALAALVVVLVAVLAWTLLRQPAPMAVIAQAPAPAPVPAVAMPPVNVAPPALAPAEPPRVAATAPPRPAAAAVQKAAPPAVRASAAVMARATPALPAVSAAPVAAPASAEARIFSIAELPEDVRQQLPKLAINGGTYSTQAAYRMLIVNGQVLHENDEPAPGVTLETIRPKDVVLRFKGYRYSVGY